MPLSAQAAPKKPTPRAQRASAQASPASRRAAALGLGSKAAAGELLSGNMDPRWQKAAGKTIPTTLRFPVSKGWYGRGFGSGEGGYHQAIDIGGTPGWPVKAAAAGLVGYAGDGINGFGNIVLLIHPGGWITVYAHNRKNRVVAGQYVDRGATIAELGSTGRSRGPHVHFELLNDGKNCDPAPLFRPLARRRNGRPLAVKPLLWNASRSRPSALQCHPRKHHPAYRKNNGVHSDSDSADLGDDDADNSSSELGDPARPE